MLINPDTPDSDPEKLPAEPTGQLATTPLLSRLEMRLQPVLVLPRPRLSGIAVDARQDRTFSNAKFAAQLPETESASFLPVLSGQIIDALPLPPFGAAAY
jgi:hypothetical protein